MLMVIRCSCVFDDQPCVFRASLDGDIWVFAVHVFLLLVRPVSAVPVVVGFGGFLFDVAFDDADDFAGTKSCQKIN